MDLILVVKRKYIPATVIAFSIVFSSLFFSEWAHPLVGQEPANGLPRIDPTAEANENSAALSESNAVNESKESSDLFVPSEDRINPPYEQTGDTIYTEPLPTISFKRERNFEIGLNGAEGNSRNLNLIVGYDALLEYGLNSIDTDIDYFYSFDENEVTKNRFLSLIRYIREIPDSDWDILVDNWFEYDELQGFRARYGLHAGGIYSFVDNDQLVLKGIIGGGASKEFRGTNQEIRPEAILGAIWELNIADKQKMYIKSAVYPNIRDTSSFRANTKAGYEIDLQENLKFSISCFNRYDSTPSDGDRRNDIDYWASLIVGF